MRKTAIPKIRSFDRYSLWEATELFELSEFDTRTQVDVTVIVVNYNTAHLLDRMYSTLDAAKGQLQLQIIVVDNASRDNSVEVLRTKYSDIELIENSVNVGFSRANNQAVSRSVGRYVLLLNTDAFMQPDTLEKTVSFMDGNPGCGVLGVKVVCEDGSLQPSCRYFPTPWNGFFVSNKLGVWLRHWVFPNARLVDDFSWDHNSVRECDWVPGCYYLIRRRVIESIGLFDPRYFLYTEEVDHCRRVRRAGWKVIYYPFTRVIHLGGESAVSAGPLTAGKQISTLAVESQLLYFRKHFGLSGLVVAVFLSLLGDAVSACGALTKHGDRAIAAAAANRAWTTLKAMVATKLASKATH